LHNAEVFWLHSDPTGMFHMLGSMSGATKVNVNNVADSDACYVPFSEACSGFEGINGQDN
jgi:hypothetical protein